MAFWTQRISAGSGGGLTMLNPSSGSVDTSNTAFGFSSQPSVVVSDGASLRINEGWTWNAGTLTATLSNPPSFDVFALK